MEWDKIKVFYTVAKEGSFNKAGKRLNLSQSAIGRSISILKHSLKTTLFIRNARGVVLTEDGETLFHHAKLMISAAEDAIKAIKTKKNEVEGKLVLAAAYGLASTSLFPYITDFLKLYPMVELNLICNDENLDLNVREADVSIRNFDINGGNSLVQTFLADRIQHLYASPEYLKKNGIPKTSEDLKKHLFISFNNINRPLPYGQIEWILRVGLQPHEPSRKPYLIGNSVECIYQAAVEGLGIIALSHDSRLLKNDKLISIFPELRSPKTQIYFVYPTSLKAMKLIKTLERYLIKCYKTKDNAKVLER